MNASPLSFRIPPRCGFALTRFSASLVLTCALVLALGAAFAFYVVKEEEVQRTMALRRSSLLLAGELRQSTDDLSRMARTYVFTGEAAVRKYYRDILDIRDGRKARPSASGRPYWDLVLAGDRPPAEPGQSVALLDLLRNLRLTEDESGLLRQAKSRSDALTATEERAMRLAEGTGPEDRSLAIAMLHDAKYRRARADIMRPIDDFRTLMERRSLENVQAMQGAATGARWTFIALGVCLVLMLLRTYAILRRTMGASLDKVHAQIAALGSGDFSRPIPVREGLRESVMGWLSETQVKLASVSREREQAMIRLRESELRFRQIAENIREAFFLYDFAGAKMLYVSPGFEKLWGESGECLYKDAKSWRNAIHPEDRTKVFDAIPAESPIGEAEVEFRIVRRDESLRWVRLRTFPICDDAGQLQRIAGVAEDTTHRMKLDVIAPKADRRFNDLVDNVGLACLMVNGAGRITYCNDRMLALTGWRRFELLGRLSRDVLLPLDGEGFPSPHSPEVEGLPRSWRAKTEVVTRDGRRLRMAWSTTLLSDESGIGGIASIGECACAGEPSVA